MCPIGLVPIRTRNGNDEANPRCFVHLSVYYQPNLEVQKLRIKWKVTSRTVVPRNVDSTLIKDQKCGNGHQYGYYSTTNSNIESQDI